MMQRNGKSLSACEGIGYGAMPYAGQRADPVRREVRFARGTAGHSDGEINPWTDLDQPGMVSERVGLILLAFGPTCLQPKRRRRTHRTRNHRRLAGHASVLRR